MTTRHKRQLHIGQTVVPYQIDWSESRETFGLRIDDSMELTVRAPISASLGEVEGVLESRQEWILEKLYGLSEQESPPYPREYLSGEKLPYCGRQYPLEVDESDVSQPQLSFDGEIFTLETHRFDAPADTVSIRRKRQAVVDWFVRRAKEDLPTRVPEFRSKLGLGEIEVNVGELQERWGEHQNGEILLNWRLILAPVRIQDYVIVHELAHEIHEDHSVAFWNSVGALIPDYEERREWLRINGNTLTV